MLDKGLFKPSYSDYIRRGSAEDYEYRHEGFGFRVRNQEGERIMAFDAAMIMKVGNILPEKENHQFTFEFGPSKTKVDYLVRRGQRKFVKDMEVLPIEECITQYKPLV